MERRHLVRLLRGRPFLRLLAVRLSGSTADGLLEAALTTFVLFSPQREPTPGRVLLAFAVLLLPYSILGPFVGVVIDRWQRQRILVIAASVRAVLVVGVAAIVSASQSGGSLGVAVLAVLGVGRFVSATLSAALPHVVDADLLVGANAVAPTAGTLMSIVGGLIGVGAAGLLGGTDRASAIVILTAAVFHAVAMVLARGIPRTLLGPERASRRTVLEVLAWLRDGVTHLVAHRRALRAILRVSGHRVAFGGATLLVLLLTRDTFNSLDHASRALRQFSFVIGVAGAGAFLAAIVTPLLSDRIGVARWARGVLVVSGIGVAALYGYAAGAPTHPGAWGSLLAGSLVIGFAGQATKITSDTIVQTTIDDRHRGRVFAIYDMALNLGIVLGTAAGAVMMPMTGQSPVFALCVGAVLVAASRIRD